MVLRSLAKVAVICGLVSFGCSQAALLEQEHARDGVATYLYKEERGGPMGSPYRRDALQLIERKCPAGHRVVREGPVRSYGAGSSTEGMESDGVSPRWGIGFECR
ncbi:MAG: hypothetical protein U0172_04535 [Nitrospiraceae bacterium]